MLAKGVLGSHWLLLLSSFRIQSLVAKYVLSFSTTRVTGITDWTHCLPDFLPPELLVLLTEPIAFHWHKSGEQKPKNYDQSFISVLYSQLCPWRVIFLLFHSGAPEAAGENVPTTISSLHKGNRSNMRKRKRNVAVTEEVPLIPAHTQLDLIQTNFAN